jgi:predicted HicB family RNase H-like nuclease
MGNKYSEAQAKATAKYQAEHTERIQVRVAKGTKDRWRAKAEAQGKSLQRMIIDAVEGT